MGTPSVVRRLHRRSGLRPESVDSDDLRRLSAYLDPDANDRETVELALEAAGAVVGARPGAGVVVVPSLVELLDDGRAETRSNALEALVAVSGDTPEALASAADRIADRVGDEADPERRAGLVVVLARIAEADPSAIGPATSDRLVDALDDESLAVRANAARAVAAVADDAPTRVSAGVPSLVALLDAEVAGPRIDAARAIAAVSEGESDAVAPHLDALFASLEDDNRRVRAESMRAIANLAMADPPSVADRSGELLSHLGERSVGDAAVEALMGTAVTDPEGTARRLCTVLASGTAAARADAERTLRGIAMRNPRPVVDALTAVLDHERPAVRRTGTELLRAVAEHRPTRTVPVADELARRLHDDDGSVREAAGGAIAATAGQRPEALAPHVDAIVEALRRNPTASLTEALVSVATADPDAVAWSDLPAGELFDHGSAEVRADACRAAEQLRAASAVDRLRELAEDPSESVREAALLAMAGLADRGAVTLTARDRERIAAAEGVPDDELPEE